jgi:hypothetical protein
VISDGSKPIKSPYGGFLKWGYPQISGIFHYKPSSYWGTTILWCFIHAQHPAGLPFAVQPTARRPENFAGLWVQPWNSGSFSVFSGGLGVQMVPQMNMKQVKDIDVES